VPFRRLARRVPLERLRQETGHDAMSAYALLMGVAGLLPSRTVSSPGATQRFLRTLWDRWWRMQSRWQNRVFARGEWTLGGLRPQNHPARRLAAAVALFAPGTNLAEQLTRPCDNDPCAWFQGALDALRPAGVLPYWDRRLSLRGKAGAKRVALIGAARAAALLANVAIPFLAATGRDVAPLLRRLPAEQSNALVRRTAFALFGPDHNPALYRTALRQQGLLQIFHDFCLNRRADGRTCPLVTALRETNGLR
jgi:hypothetical protein